MMIRFTKAFCMIPQKARISTIAAGISAVIVSAILLILVVGHTDCVSTYKIRIPKDVIKIIEKPSVDVFFPISEDLPPIEGIPEDVEEDYYPEVLDVPDVLKVSDYTEGEDNRNAANINDAGTVKPAKELIYKQKTIDSNVINILIVGSDSRNEETRGSRSDCMLLLSYNRKTQTASLVSFMRDTWVRIPNYGMERLNAAFAFGGIGLCINTINENFDLDIQNYVVINFEGLKKIVDDLDGVSVYISKNEADYINASCCDVGSSLLDEDGTQVLNGAQLLAHCRNRKSSSGDFERTRRQRDAMIALFYELKSKSVLSELSVILRDSINNVQTNIQIDTLLSLGVEAFKTDHMTLTQGRIPFDNTWYYANKDGRSVVEIDLNENIKLLHGLLYEN